MTFLKKNLLKLAMAESQPGHYLKYRLYVITDWNRFLDYYDNDPLEEIYDKLDNWSLNKLHEHFFEMVCDYMTFGKNFFYSSLDLIEKITNKRKFNIWEAQPFLENNPVTPLKRYKGETWVQHPLEVNAGYGAATKEI